MCVEWRKICHWVQYTFVYQYVLHSHDRPTTWERRLWKVFLQICTITFPYLAQIFYTVAFTAQRILFRFRQCLYRRNRNAVVVLAFSGELVAFNMSVDNWLKVFNVSCSSVMFVFSVLRRMRRSDVENVWIRQWLLTQTIQKLFIYWPVFTCRKTTRRCLINTSGSTFGRLWS